jgi:hypothetical protein
MKAMVFLSVMFLLLGGPSPLFAKAETVKMVIQGADLKTPIQITDRKVLANIQVLSGKGTYSNEPRLEEPGFIIDWPQGPTGEPPKALPHYEVSFYANLPDERRVYVVSYAFDPLTDQGYIKLLRKSRLLLGTEPHNKNNPCTPSLPALKFRPLTGCPQPPRCRW